MKIRRACFWPRLSSPRYGCIIHNAAVRRSRCSLRRGWALSHPKGWIRRAASGLTRAQNTLETAPNFLCERANHLAILLVSTTCFTPRNCRRCRVSLATSYWLVVFVSVLVFSSLFLLAIRLKFTGGILLLLLQLFVLGPPDMLHLGSQSKH